MIASVFEYNDIATIRLFGKFIGASGSLDQSAFLLYIKVSDYMRSKA